jgi:RND superfamily putative drug exporter
VPASQPSPHPQEEWADGKVYRLGGWAFQHHWRVVALWATVQVAVVAAAAAFGGKTNDKFTVAGTESQQAQELLGAEVPTTGRAAAW